jgi:hypothetical protein
MGSRVRLVDPGPMNKRTRRIRITYATVALFAALGCSSYAAIA